MASTKKWSENVKQRLCKTCTHRLRGVVDVPGRYCKHMVNVTHMKGVIHCIQYKAVQHDKNCECPKCCK